MRCRRAGVSCPISLRLLCEAGLRLHFRPFGRVDQNGRPDATAHSARLLGQGGHSRSFAGLPARGQRPDLDETTGRISAQPLTLTNLAMNRSSSPFPIKRPNLPSRWATLTGDQGAPLSDLAYVMWYSSDPAVIAVSGEGLIAAVSPGRATIYVQCGPHKASLTLSVPVSRHVRNEVPQPQRPTVICEPTAFAGTYPSVKGYAFDSM